MTSLLFLSVGTLLVKCDGEPCVCGFVPPLSSLSGNPSWDMADCTFCTLTETLDATAVRMCLMELR